VGSGRTYFPSCGLGGRIGSDDIAASYVGSAGSVVAVVGPEYEGS